MKFKKKTAMFISFTVGILMFSTTAIAEVTSKNGYEQLKDSLKYTAKSCTSTLSNYTLDSSFVVKDSGNIIYSQNSVNKYDISQNSEESTNSTFDGSVKRENYHYRDSTGYIDKNEQQDTYYVTEFANTADNNKYKLKDPFSEDRAGDIEKIADALVGNLKDSVAVTQKQNGIREISGSLSDAQIPALINALASFEFKNSFNNDDKSSIPKLVKNISVKNIKGSMTTDKNGFIQTALGSGILSGTDKNGQDHNLTFQLLVKIEDINSTAVKKPDLSGKKVLKNIEKDYTNLSNPEKYLGKYKSDIIIEDNEKFTKIGEAVINVEKIDKNNISGSYQKNYLNGYEQYADSNDNLKFTGKFGEEANTFNGKFSGVTASNKKATGTLSIDPHTATLYFNIDNYEGQNTILDGSYKKVFD
ncbi:hypothetical protein ACYUJ6_05815 [Clostridium sp. JNZ X4-2]